MLDSSILCAYPSPAPPTLPASLEVAGPDLSSNKHSPAQACLIYCHRIVIIVVVVHAQAYTIPVPNAAPLVSKLQRDSAYPKPMQLTQTPPLTQAETMQALQEVSVFRLPRVRLPPFRLLTRLRKPPPVLPSSAPRLSTVNFLSKPRPRRGLLGARARLGFCGSSANAI